MAAAVALRQLQRLVSAELRRSVLLADDDHAAGRAREVPATTRWARSGTSSPRCRSRPRYYRLNRTNTRSTDPNDPTRIVQTGSQRTNGYELGRQRAHHARVEYRRRLRVSGCIRDSARRPRRSPAPRWARCRTIRSRCGTTIEFHPRVGAGARRALSVRHVRGDRQHRHAARLCARGRGGVFHAHEASPPSGERGERLRQDGITSTPTATRTFLRDSRGPSGWD